MPVSPPVPRLPSLNALRAFEAAARLGGFALAAEELGVTPGAVAAQIKSLEEEIGAALFARCAKGVQLTPVGQRALPSFVDVFDALGQAVRDLRQDGAPHKVHIAALPALAQLWLAPRLPMLRRKFPGIDISITAMEKPPNLKRTPFDLCLFYLDETGGPERTSIGDDVIPVCIPKIAEGLRRPEDLASAICLTDATWKDDWALWLDHVLPGKALVPKGPVFSLYAVAVQEALNGAGVLMAHRSLVEAHLETGELVAPFQLAVPLPEKITLWRPPGSHQSRMLEKIIEYLKLSEVDELHEGG